jgi:hypothetical protein
MIMTELPSFPGMPRWVKISACLAGLFILLLAVHVVSGHHRGARHMTEGAGMTHMPNDHAAKQQGPLGRLLGHTRPAGAHQ